MPFTIELLSPKSVNGILIKSLKKVNTFEDESIIHDKPYEYLYMIDLLSTNKDFGFYVKDNDENMIQIFQFTYSINI